MKILITLFGPALTILITFMCVIHAKAIKCMFKEKCSSSEAIEALKQGANIYRINGYSKYGKCISSFCGKNTETYGTISNDKFSTGFVLNQEDIMANDWIIEWPKGENNAINSR